MHWFFIALLTPILHAAANHIDKHIISRYFKSGGVGSIAIFSAIFALISLPFIYLFDNTVLVIEAKYVIALILNGSLMLAYVLFYLYALEQDEASIVTPMFQLIPVFAFILGYLILGEIPQLKGIIASLLIILGSVTLSLDLNHSKFGLKKRVIGLMICSSALYALNGVIFKYFALDFGFAISLFWGMVGQVILGAILFICIPRYRTQFINVIRENTLAVLELNLFNGLIILLGDIVLSYAVLLAPVALVLAVSGFQPFFVLVLGVIITLFFPKFGKESLERKVLAQKLIGIAVIVTGSIFLN